MKVYARAKKFAKTERAKGKVFYALRFHHAMLLQSWLELGYISKMTYDYQEYLAIRKELKAKGLL